MDAVEQRVDLSALKLNLKPKVRYLVVARMGHASIWLQGCPKTATCHDAKTGCLELN